MKRVIFVIPLIFAFFIAIGQDKDKFYFYDESNPNEDLEVESYKIPNHFLGKEIATKMYFLKKTYTIVEKPSAVNPVEKTIVNKPSIFYSIKKLNKYYKKAVRKNKLSEEEARARLNNYLDICLSIYRQDTGELEEALKNSKKSNELASVFSRVVLE